MIRDPDSPAGVLWRIGWLTGTAAPPPPEPEPQPEPAWLQAPTTAELDPEWHRIGEQMAEEFAASLRRTAGHLVESRWDRTVARHCVECEREVAPLQELRTKRSLPATRRTT